MAGNAVKAGGAYVTIFTDNNPLTKGLKRASTSFKTWGASLRGIGSAGLTSAFGDTIKVAGLAALTSSLPLAVKSFADAGSALNDMSQRTGASVESLSVLKFSAEQNGSSLEALEGMIRKYQKTQASAVSGDKEAAEGFANLGLNAKALANLPVDEQLARIGERMQLLPEGMARTAVALKLFGKSGTEVLPMLSQLRRDMDRAKELGLPWTKVETDQADALGDRWEELKSVALRTAQVIGGELAPMVMAVSEPLLNTVVATKEFITANQGMVETVAIVAAGVGAAGAALVALGVTTTVVGAAIGGVVTVGGAMAATFAAVVSPVGLAVGALAALSAHTIVTRAGFDTIKTSGIAAANGIKTAFGGMMDAVAGGDLALAGNVAMAGLNVAWKAGVLPLKATWHSLNADVQQIWSTTWATAEGVVDGAFTSIGRNMLALQSQLASFKFDVGISLGINTQADKNKGMQPIRQVQKTFEEDAKRRSGEIAGRVNADAAEIKAERDKKLSDDKKELSKAEAELAKLNDEAASKKSQRQAKAARRSKTGDNTDSDVSVASKQSEATVSGLVSSMYRGGVIEGPVSNMLRLGNVTDGTTEKIKGQTRAIKDRNAALVEPVAKPADKPVVPPAVAEKPVAPPIAKPAVPLVSPEVAVEEMKKRGVTEKQLNEMTLVDFNKERERLSSLQKPAVEKPPVSSTEKTTAVKPAVEKPVVPQATSPVSTSESDTPRVMPTVKKAVVPPVANAKAEARWQKRFDDSGAAEQGWSKEDWIKNQKDKESGKFKTARSESYDDGTVHGYGVGQSVPRGAGMKLPEKGETRKRGQYLADANKDLGDFGLGERLAALKNVREQKGYPSNTSLSEIAKRHQEEYQKELQENRDKNLLAGTMPQLALKNQVGGEAGAKPGVEFTPFVPGKIKSTNRGPQERNLASLDQKIALKEQQRGKAIATAEAMKGMSDDGAPAIKEPVLIKTPQQMLGVKSPPRPGVSNVQPVAPIAENSQPEKPIVETSAPVVETSPQLTDEQVNIESEKLGSSDGPVNLQPRTVVEPTPKATDEQVNSQREVLGSSGGPVKLQPRPVVETRLPLDDEQVGIEKEKLGSSSVPVRLQPRPIQQTSQTQPEVPSFTMPDFSKIRLPSVNDFNPQTPVAATTEPSSEQSQELLTDIRDVLKRLDQRVASGNRLTA